MSTILPLLSTAFLTSLASSGHCLAMCGGIGGSLGLNAEKRRFVLAYHAGRLLSYTLLGLILGSLLPLFGTTAGLPEWGLWLRRLTAVVIALLGLQLVFGINLFRRFEQFGFHLWRLLSRVVQQFVPTRCASDAFILGMLWGLLPCGLIYAALAIAIPSGSPWLAALMMLVFGLGTLPVMLSVTLFSHEFTAWLRQPAFQKILGMVIIFCALWSWPGLFPV